MATYLTKKPLFSIELLTKFGFHTNQIEGYSEGDSKNNSLMDFYPILVNAEINGGGSILDENFDLGFSFDGNIFRFLCKFIIVEESKNNKKIRIEFRSCGEFDNLPKYWEKRPANFYSNNFGFFIVDSFNELEIYLFNYLSKRLKDIDPIHFLNYKLRTKIWNTAQRNAKFFGKEVSFFMENIRKWINSLDKLERGSIISNLLEPAIDNNIICFVQDENLFNCSGKFIRLGSMSGTLTLSDYEVQSKNTSCERIYNNGEMQDIIIKKNSLIVKI